MRRGGGATASLLFLINTMYRIYVMHPETLQTELVDTTSNESSAMVVVSVLTKSLGEDLQVFYTKALEDEFINYKNREHE